MLLKISGDPNNWCQIEYYSSLFKMSYWWMWNVGRQGAVTAPKHNLIYSSTTNDFCSFQGSSFVSRLPVVWIEQKPPLQVKPHIPVKSYHIVCSSSEASCPFKPSQILMSHQTHMTLSRGTQNKMSKLIFSIQWKCW